MSENSTFNIEGHFEFELIRDGKVIDRWGQSNTIMNVGKEHILDIVMAQGTQKTAWYVGLKQASDTVVETWTASNINQSQINEYAGTVWTNTVRPTWNDADAVASNGNERSITNDTTPATYTVDTAQSATINGAFIVSDSSTFQATSGVLLAVANFTSARSLVADDVLNVKYTIKIT